MSENLPLILEKVAKRLELIAENLKNDPNKAKRLEENSKAIKEILLTAFASSGKVEIDDRFLDNLFNSLFPREKEARLLGKETKITIERETES